MDAVFILGAVCLFVLWLIKAFFSDSPPQMTLFSIRLQDVQIDSGDRKIPAKEVQARGAFPLKEEKNTAAWISVLDENAERVMPVMCVIDQFQEDDSPAYFMQSQFGGVGPNLAISEWVRIGTVFPEIMQPPRGGQQTLTVAVRLVDLSEPPRIHFGYMFDETGLLWTGKIKFTHHFDEKGYTEIAAHREESQVLTLKIAMAVAMSDGSLNKKEGLKIQKWIRQSITQISGQEDADRKEVFNQTLRESYAEAKQGSLNLHDLASRLNDIGETSSKYQAFELGAGVMAADSKADPSEIETLNNLAEWLGLDSKRVAGIMDTHIIGIGPDISTSIEDLIGIKPGWPDERVKKHLTSEFNKWNNRLNALPEGEERDNAQHFLDRIAQARKKHVG